MFVDDVDDDDGWRVVGRLSIQYGTGSMNYEYRIV
eukprot:COSAG02_NODE_62709_length_265_cov_0.620482_1_plen_34_part_10